MQAPDTEQGSWEEDSQKVFLNSTKHNIPPLKPNIDVAF